LAQRLPSILFTIEALALEFPELLVQLVTLTGDLFVQALLLGLPTRW
jgi:hypothetical protein